MSVTTRPSSTPLLPPRTHGESAWLVIFRTLVAVVTCALIAVTSGCAMYTPAGQLYRITPDYNTERRPAIHAEVYEHLPPLPMRVILNRWAYNVGPMPSTSSIPIPSNSPVAPVSPAPNGSTSPPLPPPPGLPSGTGLDPDLLDEAQPPEFSPASPGPRTDLRSQEGGNRPGPSARANTGVRGASYEVPARQSQAIPTPAGAWLFAR